MKVYKQKNVLELFAGARCLGKSSEAHGHNVFSVDWTPYEDIDLSMDVEDMTMDHVPFIPDVIWASPDCTTYSIAACSTHRNKDRSGKSDYAVKCDRVNKHVLDLVGQYRAINPDLTFFIENPRGILRHMDFMQGLKRHTVWYCQYGDDRAKPTDVWTNSEDWSPRPECKNFKYNKDGSIIDRHCHHQSARRGAKTGTQGRANSHTRSLIPVELCNEVVRSFSYTNKQ